MGSDSQPNQFEVNLFNYFNAQYVGHLYIGGRNGSNEDLQKIRIIYDTGSHWTWVQSQSCKAQGPHQGPLCTMVAKGYDPTKSDYMTTDNTTVYLAYGKGMAEGYLVKDRICLDSEAQSCSN